MSPIQSPRRAGRIVNNEKRLVGVCDRFFLPKRYGYKYYFVYID